MTEKIPFAVRDLTACPAGASAAPETIFNALIVSAERRHFIIHPSTSVLAVMATFDNLRHSHARPRMVAAKVTFALVESSGVCDKVVATTLRTISMPGSKTHDTVYVDIPLRRGVLVSGHSYRLEISVGEDGTVLARRGMRFYSPRQLGLAPTSWYFPLGAYVALPGEYDRSLLSPGDACDDKVEVAFMLDSRLDMPVDAMPELQLCLTGPDGRKYRRAVNPVHDVTSGNSGRAARPVRVSEVCDIVNDSKGVWYAELRCMGYPFAAFLFSNAGSGAAGVWSKKFLAPLRDYTPALGAEQYKCSLVRLGIVDAARRLRLAA